MNQKKLFLVTIVICSICMTVFIALLIKNNNQHNETKINNNEIITTINNADIYKELSRHWYNYDSDGNIIGTDNLGEFKVSDGNIECSMLMLSDMTNRTINASIFVFIGGVLTEFYVDGERYTQYIFKQKKNFSDMHVNISIPINNIEKAYDNTVRICYMGFDEGVPSATENRIMCVSELKAVITDLNITDYVESMFDIVDVGENSSWMSSRNMAVVADKYIDGSIQDGGYNGLNILNNMLSEENTYIYFCGETNRKYIIYYLENGKIISDKSIMYRQDDRNTILRKKIVIETDDVSDTSLSIICVPIKEIEDNIIETNKMYGFY